MLMLSRNGAGSGILISCAMISAAVRAAASRCAQPLSASENANAGTPNIKPSVAAATVPEKAFLSPYFSPRRFRKSPDQAGYRARLLMQYARKRWAYRLDSGNRFPPSRWKADAIRSASLTRRCNSVPAQTPEPRPRVAGVDRAQPGRGQDSHHHCLIEFASGPIFSIPDRPAAIQYTRRYRANPVVKNSAFARP